MAQGALRRQCDISPEELEAGADAMRNSITPWDPRKETLAEWRERRYRKFRPHWRSIAAEIEQTGDY